MMTKTETPVLENLPQDMEPAVALAHWSDAVIDQHRFGAGQQGTVERVLARYGEGVAVMPSYDELEESGICGFFVARALEAGLDAELFGQALEDGLDGIAFGVAVSNGLAVVPFNDMLRSAGCDLTEVNTGLEHFNDASSDARRWPNAVERSLALTTGEDDIEWLERD